ncbi:SRPBCC family protein [Sphingobium aromaticiconvertens]|uniref:SRPBCC family protein n=1 Tax=Sphingobium aromaticiconvertens TaxID=365341 RepID=UPI003018929E
MLRQADRADRLFAPVLAGCTMQDDIRTVTFANGLVASEQIVTIDDADRRFAYHVMGEMFEHHSASMQIVPVDDRSCRFIWISDFLPGDRVETVQPLVIAGASALARNMEAGAANLVQCVPTVHASRPESPAESDRCHRA